MYLNTPQIFIIGLDFIFATNTQIMDFKDIVLYFVPEGIQQNRYRIMRDFARKKGFFVQDQLNSSVRHVISELKDFSQLLRLHDLQQASADVKVVNAQWIYKCAKERHLVDEEPYLIPGYVDWKRERNKKKFPLDSHGNGDGSLSSQNADRCSKECNGIFDKEKFNDVLQRKAPVKHFNMDLVEPLDFLSDYWEIFGDDRRALAFAKASATLKSLPFRVSHFSQLESLKGLGDGHAQKVVREMLETGCCQEVQNKKDSETYIATKALTNVYGIGPSLARKLQSIHNITSVSDLISNWQSLRLMDERILYGVSFYDDLTTPVSRELAERIERIVRKNLTAVKPDFHMEMAGGFRRGKQYGHDVDLLISCSAEGEEKGILSKLIRQLQQDQYILHAKHERAVYDEEVFRQPEKYSTMDFFEKCFCIFRAPLTDEWTPEASGEAQKELQPLITESKTKQNWRATRVDLIVVPPPQWAYALLGWSGSQLFMRILRHYSNTSLNMTLNSHGLWSRKEGKLLPAETEEEVFKNLGLDYKEPWNRNF